MVKTRGKKKRYMPLIVALLCVGATIILWKPLLRLPEIRESSKAEGGRGRHGEGVSRGSPDSGAPSPGRRRAGPNGVGSVDEPDNRNRMAGASGVDRATSGGDRSPAGRIVIIIDDVGYGEGQLDAYLDIGKKLTFSVIPFLPESRASARLLHDRGFEVMVHIPMEPLSYPADDPGSHALFVTDSREQVESKLGSMIEEVGFAAGANNHMGSRATADRDLMDWTMSYLRSRDLYFVDSRTTPDSCAYALARRDRVPAAERDVFLDNRDDFASISARFEELRESALRKGTAVGIGHVQSVHLPEVLRRQIPLIEEENLALVFASEAVSN